MLRRMGEQSSGRSDDLDRVRQMLFPTLGSEEGWAEIERALEGAADNARWAAIEEAAKQQDLGAGLLRPLRAPRRRRSMPG
jgi:hypothetical protein